MTDPVKPVGRTLAEFQPLRAAEQALLEACRKGEFATISEGVPEAESERNTISAEFIRFLALGGDEQNHVHEHGILLSGAWITGKLSLEAARVPCNFNIQKCHFDSAIAFGDAKLAGSLCLDGCWLPGLNGDRLACEGGLYLRGCTTSGEMRLLGAKIGGNLECTKAIFDGKDGDALSADGAVIQGSVFLSNGFTVSGEVSLMGVQIGGNLDCVHAKLDGKVGDALSADRAVIKGSVFLRECAVSGEVRLLNALIGGSLECSNATFNGKDGDALSADSADIKGNVFLRECAVSGEVRLLNARIGGILECSKTTFDGKDGDALSADSADIKGNVFLREGFTATGTVRLMGTHIGGDLECSNATFDGKGGVALLAEGMDVEGAFFFRKLAAPVNRVSLAGSHVGRLVDDAKSWGTDITLDGFTYGGFSGVAPTDAQTRLEWLNKQSKVDAGLDGKGGGFKPQPWRQLAKVLREMGHAEDARQVAIALERRRRKANLIGQPREHWGWLRSWIYRNVSRAWHLLLGVYTGYGYRPLRPLIWMVIVWLACSPIYWYAALHGVFAPSNPLIFQNPDYAVCTPQSTEAAEMKSLEATACPSTHGAGNWYLCEKLREEYSTFSPMAYSLDVILPLVDLQQETSWSPLIPTPKDKWLDELVSFDAPKHFIRLVLWFEILFGWVSSSFLVAIVSGLTERRED